MNAQVISGFPGVGKTYITKNHKGLSISDSDSSSFSWVSPGVRNPDFPRNYIRYIQENLDYYDVIFVSSHRVVRNALAENRIHFTLVYPDICLKEEYLERYRKRGSDEEFIKMMCENWEGFLGEIRDLHYSTLDEINFVCLRGEGRFLDLPRDIVRFKQKEITPKICFGNIENPKF